MVDSKLRDCTSHNIANSELFIVEGQSAGGSLIQCRDPKHHAILSLKGKIPNIACDSKDFLKNKEIIEIINALGTGFEPDFSISSLRYGKIIFAQDADSDGSHIAVLLMTVFLKLLPGLLKKGCVYKSIMPLYGTTVSKQFIPIYNDQELASIKATHPNAKIQRYNGLGEMNPDQLKMVLLDSTRKLQTINLPENPETILNLMTDSSEKRKLV